MLDAVTGALSALHAVADPLAWVVVALFAAAAVVERVDRRRASRVAAVAWLAFSAFWLAVVPEFVAMRSAIESVLAAVAVPACAYVAYLLARGNASLLALSRAVAFMGLVYLPFQAVPVLRRTLIEAVAFQTSAIVGLLGVEHALSPGPVYGYRSELAFVTGGQQYTTYIELACTGVGSMAIFTGLVAAVRAPLRRKLRAIALALSAIYLLNLLRNAFIAVAFGEQLLQVFVPEVMAAAGYAEPGLVSFFLADRVISQSLSVVALVGIAWLVARDLPELFGLAEDVLYLLTGEEYDLRGRAGDGERAVRADGEGR